MQKQCNIQAMIDSLHSKKNWCRDLMDNPEAFTNQIFGDSSDFKDILFEEELEQSAEVF